MQGKYLTPNGEVNVVEFDPDTNTLRVEGSDKWISESEYSKWTKQEEEIIEDEGLSAEPSPEVYEQPQTEEKPKRKRTKKSDK